MRRVLIVRTSAIGDVVFASPFAAALKRTHPNAHLAWLVEPGIAELLAADPAIDELIAWPKAEWLALWKARRYGALAAAVRRFAGTLRARRFDTAIDLQGLLKSGLLARLSGAPRRVGLGSREGSGWLMTEVVTKDPKIPQVPGVPKVPEVPKTRSLPDGRGGNSGTNGTSGSSGTSRSSGTGGTGGIRGTRGHQNPGRPNAAGGDPARRISSEYLHLAVQLGLDVEPFLPRLFVADAVAARARALLAAHRLGPRRYAALAPFTTRPQKHWFEDAWQALARRLPDEFGLVPVILGGPADREAAERIAASVPGAVALAGATRLAEAAALVRDAALLVGVDTGLTHMGVAFGTPTVALFGSTRPYLDAARPNARVIWLGLQCSPCRRRPSCNGAFTCLRDIRPERVLDEARAAIAAGNGA